MYVFKQQSRYIEYSFYIVLLEGSSLTSKVLQSEAIKRTFAEWCRNATVDYEINGRVKDHEQIV